MMTTTLIIGASGTVGTEIATQLAHKGHTLRKATHRSPEQADQVQLDLLSGEGIDAALAGADAAFLMAPPGHSAQDKLLKPLIAAAQKHQLKKVVLMTAMGADAVEESPMRQAELALENSGLNYAIIRPNWFMQNFNTYWLQGILEAGVIALPTGDAAGSFIDARDIGAVAATLLDSNDEALLNQAYNLTGAESLTHDEVAAILTRVTGKVIRYEDTAPAKVKTNLLAAGLPEDYADFMLMILDAFKQGYSAATTPAVQAITGKAPIAFETYAKDYAGAFN
jgi:uncharacterized protein YbjT (DUF2867 family)